MFCYKGSEQTYWFFRLLDANQIREQVLCTISHQIVKSQLNVTLQGWVLLERQKSGYKVVNIKFSIGNYEGFRQQSPATAEIFQVNLLGFYRIILSAVNKTKQQQQQKHCRKK